VDFLVELLKSTEIYIPPCYIYILQHSYLAILQHKLPPCNTCITYITR